MKAKYLVLAGCMMLGAQLVLAQERKDKTAVTYEELYDEPYSINKLFVGFQPFYGELFATNMNAGFGAEVSYYHKEKFDLKGHFRKTYSSSFYDFNRDIASKNSNVDNRSEIFNYFEIGGTYHFKDFESASKTKMVLFKNAYKGNKWASRVPLHAEVPCKLRKIYGARLGAIVWNSTTDISRTLKQQNLTNADLVNAENIGLPLTYVDPITFKTRDFKVFSNIYATGLYVGGSMTWIRNVAVSFDKYEEGIDDGIMTLFFDILYSPSLKMEDIKYNNSVYSISPIKMSPVGFRLGIDGKFNRQLSWGYGGEVGYRPSIQGQGVFAMFKISFPIYATNLDYKVESFGK